MFDSPMTWSLATGATLLLPYIFYSEGFRIDRSTELFLSDFFSNVLFPFSRRGRTSTEKTGKRT
jgi:hypothetical protein